MAEQSIDDAVSVGLQDLHDSGFGAALHLAEGAVDPENYWQALYAAHAGASEARRFAIARVLKLLGDACSMMLSPAANAKPFRPRMEFDQQRTADPSDFSDSDLDFLQIAAKEIADPWLKGRLSDIVWVRRRRAEFALMAIDAYCQLPLTEESWHIYGKFWERALRLSIAVGKAGHQRWEAIQSRLVKALLDAAETDGILTYRIASLLRSCRVGRDDAPAITAALQRGGEADYAKSSFLRARANFEEAAFWADKVKMPDLKAEMLLRVAQTFESEGKARLEGLHSNHLAASQDFESAIQAYRSIPRLRLPPVVTLVLLRELRLSSPAVDASLQSKYLWSTPPCRRFPMHTEP